MFTNNQLAGSTYEDFAPFMECSKYGFGDHPDLETDIDELMDTDGYEAYKERMNQDHEDTMDQMENSWLDQKAEE